MAIRYYDDILVKKLQRWLPEATGLRVLRPDETNKLFNQTADDLKDKPFSLPMIALSRKPDLELLSVVKSPRSYDGLKVSSASNGSMQMASKTAQMNVIPIRPEYQLDIYTKTAEEGEEYLRGFLFKLINNPTIAIEVPYNDLKIEHVANIRLLSNVSDTSAITERIFSGQFTRWTIQFELHDAFLFSIPYKTNWILRVDEDAEMFIESNKVEASKLEMVSNLAVTKASEIEDEDLSLIFGPIT